MHAVAVLPPPPQYRELTVGTRGSAATLGATCDILFTVYRLSPGAHASDSA
jgi:hypothetical protein